MHVFGERIPGESVLPPKNVLVASWAVMKTVGCPWSPVAGHRPAESRFQGFVIADCEADRCLTILLPELASRWSVGRTSSMRPAVVMDRVSPVQLPKHATCWRVISPPSGIDEFPAAFTFRRKRTETLAMEAGKSNPFSSRMRSIYTAKSRLVVPARCWAC